MGEMAPAALRDHIEYIIYYNVGGEDIKEELYVEKERVTKKIGETYKISI